MKSLIFSFSFLVLLLVGSSFACTDEESTTPDTKVIVTVVTLNKSALSLEIGSKEILTPTILPDKVNNKGFAWTSSKVSVATGIKYRRSDSGGRYSHHYRKNG